MRRSIDEILQIHTELAQIVEPKPEKKPNKVGSLRPGEAEELVSLDTYSDTEEEESSESYTDTEEEESSESYTDTEEEESSVYYSSGDDIILKLTDPNNSIEVLTKLLHPQYVKDESKAKKSAKIIHAENQIVAFDLVPSLTKESLMRDGPVSSKQQLHLNMYRPSLFDGEIKEYGLDRANYKNYFTPETIRKRLIENPQRIAKVKKYRDIIFSRLSTPEDIKRAYKKLYKNLAPSWPLLITGEPVGSVLGKMVKVQFTDNHRDDMKDVFDAKYAPVFSALSSIPNDQLKTILEELYDPRTDKQRLHQILQRAPVQMSNFTERRDIVDSLHAKNQYDLRLNLTSVIFPADNPVLHQKKVKTYFATTETSEQVEIYLYLRDEALCPHSAREHLANTITVSSTARKKPDVLTLAEIKQMDEDIYNWIITDEQDGERKKPAVDVVRQDFVDITSKQDDGNKEHELLRTISDSMRRVIVKKNTKVPGQYTAYPHKGGEINLRHWLQIKRLADKSGTDFIKLDQDGELSFKEALQDVNGALEELTRVQQSCQLKSRKLARLEKVLHYKTNNQQLLTNLDQEDRKKTTNDYKNTKSLLTRLEREGKEIATYIGKLKKIKNEIIEQQDQAREKKSSHWYTPQVKSDAWGTGVTVHVVDGFKPSREGIPEEKLVEELRKYSKHNINAPEDEPKKIAVKLTATTNPTSLPSLREGRWIPRGADQAQVHTVTLAEKKNDEGKTTRENDSGGYSTRRVGSDTIESIVHNEPDTKAGWIALLADDLIKKRFSLKSGSAGRHKKQYFDLEVAAPSATDTTGLDIILIHHIILTEYLKVPKEQISCQMVPKDIDFSKDPKYRVQYMVLKQAIEKQCGPQLKNLWGKRPTASSSSQASLAKTAEFFKTVGKTAEASKDKQIKRNEDFKEQLDEIGELPRYIGG